MNWRQLPNLVTFARFLLAIPVAIALIGEAYSQALILFAVAGFSDGLDGFLARRFGWFSRLGSLIDPLADKVLLVTTFTVLTVMGHLPLSFLLVVLGRDIIILMGACAYHFVVGQFEGQPSALSKTCTFIQITFGLLLVTLLADWLSPEWHALIAWLQWAVVVSCLLSGAHYVVLWGRRAREQIKARHISEQAFGNTEYDTGGRVARVLRDSVAQPHQ
jgi:cardiolipin synthase